MVMPYDWSQGPIISGTPQPNTISQQKTSLKFFTFSINKNLP
jgi:hypothetical protein